MQVAPAICIVAAHRFSGKTALTSSLIKALKSMGYCVASAKHIHGSIDVEDKDTRIHGEAGARFTIAVSDEGLATFEWGRKASIEEISIGLLERGFKGLIICEGFKHSTLPKIAIISGEEDEKLVESLDNIVALVADQKLLAKLKQKYVGIPIFSFNNYEEIALFAKNIVAEKLLERMPKANCRRCGYESCQDLVESFLKGKASLKNCKLLQLRQAELEVNGVKIPLSQYPQQVFADVVSSLVKSLKGIPEEVQEINLKIKLSSAPR
ncbi:MAG: hypothetical protein DRJ31_02245 [Candidatus Methanomethylicota archaeon]|uniref:4Fe-4S domain-containing protein n=1 Tax=Thermoproteota archaeon TaxID=2056631 RepID=A0A497EUZ8_9CREN|nr:MAG: hypothetical protein DRJ31_02245 [Candidatus Verstraetearchaeota archaeon]RLE50852.1 MAG: hypothetical protein DRJ33_06970 [Candidatus Verstraetearchaeota archaeon]